MEGGGLQADKHGVKRDCDEALQKLQHALVQVVSTETGQPLTVVFAQRLGFVPRVCTSQQLARQ